ncbi:MAG: hypothetical protein WEE89_22705 [Gemmatimonadota bacterium]
MSAKVMSLVVLTMFGMQGTSAQNQPVAAGRANWALAEKFNQQSVNNAISSTSVNGVFILKTDSAWYNWRDEKGSRFMLLVPATKTKKPLFDQVKLAADLSMLHRRSFESKNLPFTTIDFADSTNASVFQFRVDSMLYEFDLKTAALISKGRAPRGGGPGGRGGRGGGGGGRGGGGRAGGPADVRNF